MGDKRIDLLRNAIFSAVCIALNVALNKVAVVLQLPLFLDTVGTILSGALVPPIFAVLVGVLSNLLGGVVTHPVIPFFVGTQVVVALMAVVTYRRGWFNSLKLTFVAGILIGIVSAVVSTPVTVVLFGGVTEPGATTVNAILLASGLSLWSAVLGGTLAISCIDKICAAVVVWLLLKRLPTRLRNHNA